MTASGQAEHNGPPVDIRPQTVACPAHGEHLRANWPSGFAAFSMTIIHAALAEGANDFALVRAAGWEREGDPFPPTEAINAVLAKRPLCYFVPREVIQTALLEMGTLRIGLCHGCGQSNIGGIYTINVMGRTTEMPHYCVTCALNAGEALHRARPNGGVWGP